MKKEILAFFLASCLLWFLGTAARGTLYISNLEQAPTSNAAIGSDYWVAQAFNILASDPKLYTLDTIQLRFDPAIGNPSGLAVSVYSSPLSAPQVYLGTLSGSANPLAGGVYDYAASGITLSGEGSYFAVVTSSTPIAQGAYVWSATEGVTASGSWAIDNVYYTSSDGLDWDLHNREEVFQIAIHATIVPEPTTVGLIGLGLGGLWLLRRRT